jgi:hypothetical protein
LNWRGINYFGYGYILCVDQCYLCQTNKQVALNWNIYKTYQFKHINTHTYIYTYIHIARFESTYEKLNDCLVHWKLYCCNSRNISKPIHYRTCQDFKAPGFCIHFCNLKHTYNTFLLSIKKNRKNLEFVVPANLVLLLSSCAQQHKNKSNGVI